MPDNVTKLEYLATHLASAIYTTSNGLGNNFTDEAIKRSAEDSVKIYQAVMKTLKESVK